jgi:serine/threonine protein phosphatase PrpC
MGILNKISPEEYSLKLRENDILVFTSDGIGEETYPAISEILRRSSKLSSDAIGEKIMSAQKTFSTAFSDDTTVVVVKLKRN